MSYKKNIADNLSLNWQIYFFTSFRGTDVFYLSHVVFLQDILFASLPLLLSCFLLSHYFILFFTSTDLKIIPNFFGFHSVLRLIPSFWVNFQFLKVSFRSSFNKNLLGVKAFPSKNVFVFTFK